MSSLTNFVEDPFFKTAGFGSRDVTPFRSSMDPLSSMMTPWSGGGGGFGNMLQPFGFGGNMLAPFRENMELMNRNIRPLESILSCDIVERENDFIVNVDLPGVKPEDLSVEVTPTNLVIKGKRETSSERGSPNDIYYRRERASGEVSRSIPIPENANALEASTCLNHGMLCVTFPKLQSSVGSGRVRKLEIKSTDAPTSSNKKR